MWFLLSPPAAATPTTFPTSAPHVVMDRWTASEGLPIDHVTGVAYAPDGAVWVSTLGGLARIEGGDVTAYGPGTIPGLVDARLVSAVFAHELVVLSESGRLFVLRDDRMVAVDAEVVGGRVKYLVEAGGQAWVLGTAGLGRVVDGAIVSVSPPRLQPGADELFRSGALLVVNTTTGGRQVFRADGDQLGWVDDLDDGVVHPGDAVPAARPDHGHGWRVDADVLRRDGTDVYTFPDGLALLGVDDDQRAWVAMVGAGLGRTRTPAVETLRVRADGTGIGVVHSVAVHEGTLLAAGVDGAYRWIDGAWTPLLRDGGFPRHATSVQRAGERAFVGYRGASCEVRGAECVPLGFPLGQLYDAVAHPDGSLWAITWAGVEHVRGDRADVVWGREPPVSARSGVVLADGSLLATTRGAGLLLVRDGVVDARTAGLPTDVLRHAALGPDGFAWVTTEGGGICRVGLPVGEELAAADVRCLGEREGLPDGFVHAVAWDDDGRQWLSTNRGLVLLRPNDVADVLDGRAERVAPLVLGVADGLVDPECNGVYGSPVGRLPDGRLAFPTQDGVAVLHPDRVDTTPPEVRADGIVVDGEAVADGATLPPDVGEVTVAWGVRGSGRSDQARFRVRLDGGPWGAATTRRQQTWSALGPGPHDVEVQAGLAGVWGPPARVAQVMRTPSVTEHPAFPFVLAAAVGVLGLVGWGLYALRVRRRREALEAIVVERTAELAERNRVLQEQRATLAAQKEQLAEVDRQRVRFVANISHELRTPLTLVNAPLDQIDEGQLPPAARANLALARRSGERLTGLVGQLIDVARIDAGGMPLRARNQDLGAFCGRTLDRFAPRAAQEGLTLSVTAPSVTAWFDPDHLDKVLTNLVGNAVKFTPAGGRVAVTLTVEGAGEDGLARVTVDDSGPGVPAAQQPRVFDRFYQVDDTDTRRHEGAGIGLSLARDLVRLHGGAVGVAPSPLGGARFWFTLPLGTAHLDPEEIDLHGEPVPSLVLPEAPAVPAHGPRPRLLVVEDHPDMRAYLAQSLSEAFAVRTAPDGAAALDAMAADPPDVVLSDVMMPGVDGLTLCRRMRALPALASIPVMLLSAKSEGRDRETGLTVADDYLTKPFRITEVVLRLRRLVHRGARPDEAPSPARPVAQQAFLDRLEGVVFQNLADEGFRAGELADALHTGPRQLHRKLVELVGTSPSAWLRERRLTEGRKILKEGRFTTVAEVAAAVGMTPSYFSRTYRQWAGHPPSTDLHR